MLAARLLSVLSLSWGSKYLPQGVDWKGIWRSVKRVDLDWDKLNATQAHTALDPNPDIHSEQAVAEPARSSPTLCTQGFCGMSKCYFASNASKVGRSRQGEVGAARRVDTVQTSSLASWPVRSGRCDMAGR